MFTLYYEYDIEYNVLKIYTKKLYTMFKKILISTLTAASMLNSASALELGSFLLKLQGGYTMSDSSFTANQTGTNNSAKVTNNNLNGFQGVVGFGYVASEDIWTDMTVSFDSTKTKNSLTNKAITQVENNNVAGLLNAYYGFNMGHSFSPYIMCGLGVGMSKAKVSLPTAGMVINTATIADATGQLSSKNTSYFAYQGGFGMSFEVMKSIALDLGYRVGNGNTAKLNTTYSTVTLLPKNQLKQSVLLGVSIAF
jgi:opacity protein-like surface antigen